MAPVFSNHTTRTIRLPFLLLWICFKLVLVLADRCPLPCTCQDNLNLHIDCSNKILLTPPIIPASTLTLDLSHNALGPILNVSFVQMHNLQLIDLSQNALTHVMECTFTGMLGLKTVLLRENRLTSLPEGLFTDTTKVEHLDLSHNLFVQLPQDVMKHLPGLKTFDISHNLIIELKLGPRFQVPRLIETIDLSHNHIEAIRNDSFEIASQWEASTGRTLKLAFCRISSIESEAFSKVPNIHDLDLTGNTGITLEMLKNLVKELESGARNLDRLSLGYLNLTTIVPLFTQVSELSLKFLNVSFNNIIDVPLDVFSTIRSLRVLDLSWNSVTKLAAGFSDLSNLRVLNISHNKMESFQGDAVSHLSNLHTLDLSHNKLTKSNRVQLSPLTNLLYLNMNNNFLASVILPRNTSNLRFLDYHSNRITEFSGLDDAGALELIDLGDNDLRSVAGFLFRGIKLLKLANFSKNSIETIDRHAFLPRAPLILDISHNYLKSMHNNSWVATQELYLNHNEISNLDIETFQGMTSLYKLDLSQNRLFTLHENLFTFFINLKHLNLSHNYLDNVPWVNLFRNLDQLDVLDLGHNNISHLATSTLLPLRKIKTLYLQKNLLQTIIPTVFRDVSGLKEVDLSNNPFHCSCDMLAFKDWLQRTKISVFGLYVINSTAYHCRSPAKRVGVHVLHWSEDEFECSNSILYLIVVCSVGILLIITGVVASVTYRFYKNWKQKEQQTKKQKEDKEKQKVEKLADMVRLSNQEIAQAIQEAIDRKHSRIHQALEKQNNYITRSRQSLTLTQPEKSKEDSKDRKRKFSDETNLKQEVARSKTKQYDKLKKDELNNEELEKQQEREKVGAKDKYIDMRRSEGRQQGDDRFVPYRDERRMILIRELQHRYKDRHSEAQRRNENKLFNYAYMRDPRYRQVPTETTRRNDPYIISPAYTYHDFQDNTNYRHVPQAEPFQGTRIPYYQMDGYNTMPAVDSVDIGWPHHGREARVHEQIPDYSRDHLPPDANFVDEEEPRYYNRKHPDEQPNSHYGHQRSKSHSFLPEDYPSKKLYLQRDRAQRQYERILQTHRHPSQRAASQPVLATDWL